MLRSLLTYRDQTVLIVTSELLPKRHCISLNDVNVSSDWTVKQYELLNGQIE